MEATNSEDQSPNLHDEPGNKEQKEPVIDLDNENEDKKKGTRVKRSFVWEHFTFIEGSSTKVKCPYCSITMAAGTKQNGTSAMAYHLRNVCKRSPFYNQQDAKKQSKLVFKPTTMGESKSNLTSHSFNQENGRKYLARMCIKDNRPFSIVDDEGFREFVWEICPMFKLPSRWTVARDCLSLYQEEKKKLKHLLKNQTVSLTTDTWTSVENHNYMCLTAHWVDETWTLRKKILNFCQISNHKGVTIGKLVYRCLQEWGIERVFTVTVDNASSNDRAIKYLKSMLKGPRSILDCKYMHLRCCAHIINLVVRDGLDEQFDSINKFRNAVRYLRSSPSRYDSFLECVKFEKIECKSKPCLDVGTRWNSTFLMLQMAEKYSKAFTRLHEIDFNYGSYFYSEINDGDCQRIAKKRKKFDRTRALGAPEEEDWVKARHFMDYLRIFFNVTKKVSGSKYVTSNLFVGELVTMHATISNMCLDKDDKKKSMALSMKVKSDKYWDNLDNMNFLLYVALVLDPRNKMFFLGYCLELIYGTNVEKINEINNRVNATLKDLFNHYKKMIDKENEKSTTLSSSSTSTSFSSGVDLDLHEGYVKYLETRGRGNNISELDIYLADATKKKLKGDEFDLLSWWKINSGKYPILSQIAKDVLGMPISTVASESAFSTGGRVIDKFRSSLTPKTAEALICTQDWIRTTKADLQEMPIHGLSLQDLTDNLKNLEIDYFSKEQKSHADSLMDDED